MRPSLLFFAGILLCTVPAVADDLFTLTSGSNTVSFTLPNSGPTLSNSMAFQYTGLQIQVNGTTLNDAAVDFYSSSDGGGMEIIDLDPLFLNLEGDQIFGGSTDSPIFSPSTFSLTSLEGSDFGGSMQLDVSPLAAEAPEPTSIALLGTGLLGVVGTLRRRIV